MAVRQAAAAKWAQRRATEARQKGDDKDGDGTPLPKANSGSDLSPQSPARRGLNRRGRMQTAPAQVPMQWDTANNPAYGMFPNPFLMNPAAAAAAAGAAYSGMYNPFFNPAAMSPYGVFPSMGMPMMPGMGGETSPPAAKSRSERSAAGAKEGITRKPGRAKTTQEMTRTKTDKSEDGGQTTKSRGKKSKGGSKDASGEVSPGKAKAAAVEATAPAVVLVWAEVLPQIVGTARTEVGSKFLQAKLEGTEVADKQAIFDAVLPEAPGLSSDPCAAGVVQKLLDTGSAEQKKALVAALQADLLKNTNDAHGCRVVQKMLEFASREALVQMAGELAKDVDGCIESMHGNHVIQKCVERMPPDSVGFIIKAIEAQTVTMASHMYGCRVVQRLLEHCAPSKLETMLDQILGSTAMLAQDGYGNYVIQHTLQHGRKEDKRKIIEVIRGDIVNLSKNKCSSNVVDKCFEVSTIGEHAQALEAERASLMRAILGEPGSPTPPLTQMVEDRFGNYIVQRVIEHSRGAEREELLQQLRNAEPQLRGTVKGKKILATVQREFGLGQAKTS